MKHPVKLLFVFLAALTMAVLIAGCSSSSDNQTTDENLAFVFLYLGGVSLPLYR